MKLRFLSVFAVAALLLGMPACGSDEPEIKKEPVVNPEPKPDDDSKDDNGENNDDNKGDDNQEEVDPVEIEGKDIYVGKWGGEWSPLTGLDLQDPKAKWNYHHAYFTENVAIFWQKDFGKDPSDAPKMGNQSMSFDVERLAEKLEEFYAYYRDVLKFIKPGSKAETYRMNAYVRYINEGTVYGGSEDNMIGALYMEPSRMDAHMNAVAHELGHCFQFQATADLNADNAWGGSPFFEMTSQWMLWQVNPNWIDDETYHWEYAGKDGFAYLTHKAFLHWDNAYHSPYILEAWAIRHGVEVIGELYRQAKYGEDPLITYKKMWSLSQDALNDEMFADVCRVVNMDYPRVWDETRKYAGQAKSTVSTDADGWIEPTNKPEVLGFNVIPIDVPEAGAKISIQFEGKGSSDKLGWRYGFVGIGADGNTIYGEMAKAKSGNLSFTAPAGEKMQKLFLVVMGAPSEYNNINGQGDNYEFPYRFKLLN